MDGWSDFVREVKQYYDVDMACLTESYKEEQADYFSRTAAWADVHPSQALGPPACLKSYDLLTLSLEELKADLQATFKLRLLQSGPVEALAGYFDVQFRGSPQNPTDFPVTLTTAPDPTGLCRGPHGPAWAVRRGPVPSPCRCQAVGSHCTKITDVRAPGVCLVCEEG